jgi:2-polyprenyl-6-methoxyphenol hydroxylase-like FAD-dependent oxidoreductase
MPEHMVSAPVRTRQIGGNRVTIDPRFLPFVTELFGARNAKLWKDCTDQGKVTPHPVWEFATDKAVRGRVILLGDAAHMASPRTGAGAHTAFVDAIVLGSVFEIPFGSKTVEEALETYNKSVVERGMALHKRSLDCAKHFAPKGEGGIAPEDVLKMLLANKG